MPGIEIAPVTSLTWPDLVRFFESHSATNYCWCLSWRVTSSEFQRLRARDRRERLAETVDAQQPIGILGYLGGEPIGWCSVAPWESYARLQRSRSIERPDPRPTWAVLCLFIDPTYRGQEVTVELLRAAAAYACEQGAALVEGYPVEPRRGETGQALPSASYVSMGTPEMYKRAGYEPVERQSGRLPRVVMRYECG